MYCIFCFQTQAGVSLLVASQIRSLLLRFLCLPSSALQYTSDRDPEKKKLETLSSDEKHQSADAYTIHFKISARRGSTTVIQVTSFLSFFSTTPQAMLYQVLQCGLSDPRYYHDGEMPPFMISLFPLSFKDESWSNSVNRHVRRASSPSCFLSISGPKLICQARFTFCYYISAGQ